MTLRRFPESVVSLMRGELGFPPEGFPKIATEDPLGAADGGRPGANLPPVDLEKTREDAQRRWARSLRCDLACT